MLLSRNLKKEPAIGGCCRCGDVAKEIPAEEPGVQADVQTESRVWLRIAIALVLAGQGMAFSLAINLTPPLYGSATYVGLHGALAVSALVVMGLLGLPLMQRFLAACRERKITVEALFFISMLGAFVGSVVSSVTGHGDVYYEVVAIVLVIYTVGSVLGERSRKKAMQEAGQLRETFSNVWVETVEGREVQKLVADLAVGDKSIVGPGQPVSVDGVIVEGEGYFSETTMTGEPDVVFRKKGDRVLAGTYSVDARFKIEMSVPYQKRLLDQVLQSVEQAKMSPGQLQNQANAIMQWFVPLVVSISLGTFAFWFYQGSGIDALIYAMTVLLVACPCALGLATPLAVWGGIVQLAKLGLVTRTGEFLDVLGKANQIIFDKTGTLTDEKMELSEINISEQRGWNRERVESMLGFLQRNVDHPVAKAFHDLPLYGINWKLKACRVVPGKGIEASLLDEEGVLLEVRIGEADFVCPKEDSFTGLNGEVVSGRKKTYVSLGGEPLAVAFLNESIREESRKAITDLKAMGLQIFILSGDPNPSLSELGGVEVEAGLTPMDKKNRLERSLKEGNKIIFVGDGINDTAAMSLAHASIAMGEGVSLAKSTSSAVLMGEHLSAIARGILICRKITRRIHGNIVFAGFYNFLGMSVAACGKLHPVFAALLMLVSSSLVSIRALKSVQG